MDIFTKQFTFLFPHFHLKVKFEQWDWKCLYLSHFVLKGKFEVNCSIFHLDVSQKLFIFCQHVENDYKYIIAA